MRTILAILVLALAAPLAACSSTGDGDGDSTLFEVPDPPPGGAQLVSPTFTVPAGSETFVCMRFPYEVTETMYVQSSVAYQAEGGHHSMLYYVVGTTPLQDDPHECDETDMQNLRFVGVGTGYGYGIDMPDGYVLEIPAGARLYTQSHYVNLEPEEVLVQDVINLELLPADQVTNKLGSYVNVDLTLELPPAEETTRVLECKPPHEINVPFFIPHMHEWGRQMKVEIERSGGGTEVVWDGAWDEALRDDFPILDYDPHVTVGPDDIIRTTCTWQNTESEAMLFPKEMCATFMLFYPSEDGAMVVCDETGGNYEL